MCLVQGDVFIEHMFSFMPLFCKGCRNTFFSLFQSEEVAEVFCVVDSMQHCCFWVPEKNVMLVLSMRTGTIVYL